jgi:hypothetical protein
LKITLFKIILKSSGRIKDLLLTPLPFRLLLQILIVTSFYSFTGAQKMPFIIF